MTKVAITILSILILLFIFIQVNSPTEQEKSTAVILDSDNQNPSPIKNSDSDLNRTENQPDHGIDSQPDEQTISFQSQNLSDLFLDGFNSLENRFQYLEDTARENPQNAYSAADMLSACRFNNYISLEEIEEMHVESYGSQFHLDEIKIFHECDRILKNSLFEEWELHELAARGGVEEAIIGQWSYPPSNSGSGELDVSYEDWKKTSFQRLVDLVKQAIQTL